MISANTAWGNAVGTGITGPYSIPFALYSQSHLTVIEVDNTTPTAPVVTTMNLGTDYAFTSWLPDTKGFVSAPQITFVATVTAGFLIIFLLTPPGTQLVSNSNFAQYSPTMQEQQADIEDQYSLRINELVSKALRCPNWESSAAVDMTIPSVAIRANKFLAFDVNGKPTMSTVSSIGSVTFTAFGQTLVALASLTSLLQLLGLYIGPASVANGAALAAIATPQGGWIAYQIDTGSFWAYNASATAWQQIPWSNP